MAPIVLRDYQQQLLTDLRAALKVYRRVCAVMPTGAGKGQTIGAIVQGAASKGRRVLVLAHRAELIEQLTGTVRAWGVRALFGLCSGPGLSQAPARNEPQKPSTMHSLTRRLE